MKFNFKTIIIIFLVGLLGGIIGTFGVIEINKKTDNKIIEEDSSVVLHTVDYPKIEKSDYTIAINKAYYTVVEIISEVQTQSFFGTSTGMAAGSGVIVSDDGYIVTNNHVVENAIAVKITMYNDDVYDAKIIGTDPKSDLAVLKIDAKNLKCAAISDSSKLELGQECIVIGNPLGEGISCSNGIISALAKEINVNNYSMTVLQTNAAVNEGNSGGGLFNMNGDLIGIVNAKSSGAYSQATVEGMGYAIPANTVQKIIKDLVDYGYVKTRATLGVSVYTTASYSDGNITGLVVADVVAGGAADEAGIKQFDIITAIDGKQTTSYSELSKLLDGYDVGDEAIIEIYRGYERIMNDRNSRPELEKIEVKVKLQEAVQTIEEK